MEVIYQDDDLLIVNKPSGLVVDRETLDTEDRLVVHRLDKDTSGLLVLGKTREALENIQRQFKERKVKKRYLALVHGKVTHPSGVIDKPMGRNPKGGGKFVVRLADQIPRSARWWADQIPRSARWWRESVTEYSVKKRFENYTLLDLTPLSGRTHQIRVHLKSIGHPVVGDKLYASRRQQKEDEKFCERQFLHAYRLGFEHPRTGEWMVFEVDLPEDLKDVLEIFNFQAPSSNEISMTNFRPKVAGSARQ